MNKLYTDRSRCEAYQRCPRARFLGYHEGPNGLGIQSSSTPLALAVGGAVHAGLAELLQGRGEEVAVQAALNELTKRGGHGSLQLDAAESAALALLNAADGVGAEAVASAAENEISGDVTGDPATRKSKIAELADSMGLDINDPMVVALTTDVRNRKFEYDAYLWAEQSALTEGMVRAYSRRRLGKLLEEFVILEVEREGEWQMRPPDQIYENDAEIIFMSRPDALLLSKTDNQLYILSFKTAASWDIRKSKDIEHDMQGLSEGVEIEQRLAGWWREIHNEGGWRRSYPSFDTYNYLNGLNSPPRIAGIRYEFLLKGDRWKDKDLSAQMGVDCRSQRSPLVRGYVNKKDETQICWSWDFLKEDGTASNLAWQNWKSRPIWEVLSGPSAIKRWIDMLEDSQVSLSAYDPTVGMEPREIGWSSRAQSVGLTQGHPLDSMFIQPITVYRQDDQLRDWIEQIESQEHRVAEGIELVKISSGDEDARRSELNVHFPQSRHACEYPSTCQFVPVCWGGQDIQRDPIGVGGYKVRVPNHPQELG